MSNKGAFPYYVIIVISILVENKPLREQTCTFLTAIPGLRNQVNPDYHYDPPSTTYIEVPSRQQRFDTAADYASFEYYLDPFSKARTFLTTNHILQYYKLAFIRIIMYFQIVIVPRQ